MSDLEDYNNDEDNESDAKESSEGDTVSLENIHVDCFRQIVKYLEIEDKKKLRLCCNTLSERIEELDHDILILTARSGPDLREIARLPHVKGIRLNLAFTLRSTGGVPDLLSLSASVLRSLDLSGTRVTGQELAGSTIQLAELNTLNLASCELLTDAGLSDIFNVCGHQLQSLDISDTNITGRRLCEADAKLKRLENLNISRCCLFAWTDQIQLLSITGSGLITLDLSMTGMTGEGLTDPDLRLTSIERLNLSRCKQLTDAGLIAILRIVGAHLRTLDLFGTRITGQGLADCLLKFPNLKNIYMDDCQNLSQAALRELEKPARKFPYLAITV